MSVQSQGWRLGLFPLRGKIEMGALALPKSKAIHVTPSLNSFREAYHWHGRVALPIEEYETLVARSVEIKDRLAALDADDGSRIPHGVALAIMRGANPVAAFRSHAGITLRDLSLRTGRRELPVRDRARPQTRLSDNTLPDRQRARHDNRRAGDGVGKTRLGIRDQKGGMLYLPARIGRHDDDQHSIQDLMRILDENPEWLEEMRSRLLTRELLEMPDKLAQLSDRVTQLSEDVQTLAAEMRAFAAKTERRFDLMDRRFDLMDRRFDLMDRRFDLMDRRFDLMDKRFDRMENSIGRMKAAFAERRVLRQTDIIAGEMDLAWVRNLEYEEVRDLVQRSDRSDIPLDDIKSFRKADLIMEARDADGGTHYVPVEVSFTADARDTDWVLRNACFMTRFTGSPAHPAVAGLHKDDDIRELFESGTIHWYQLDEEDFEAR